jgi:hypothetical protein
MKKAFFAFIPVTGLIMLFVGGAPVAAQSPFQVDPLDVAIREASNYLNGNIPRRNKTVFLNITSDYPDLSEYILSLLSENAVNDKVFSVVDRGQIESIRAELSFQMSGDVDDNSAQSIGKMLGAQSIVSGAVSKIGTLYRLQVKAIEVQTAEVKGQWSKNFPSGSPTITALTANHAGGANTTTGGQTINNNTSGQTAAPVRYSYKIGDTGPAGGLIFYDKGNNSGGWRYLEVAPEDLSIAQWGRVMITGATATEAGMGRRNTRILAGYPEGKAAQLCQSYNQRGYNDWYLPSKDELNFMYTNLERKGLGNFNLSGFYWSSTEINNQSAWIQRFSDGFQEGAERTWDSGDNSKTRSYNVRPIRQF